MFTRDEIKARHDELLQEAAKSGDSINSELNLACIIAGCVFFGKTQRSGEDFIQHALEVATDSIESKNKRIIAILHDVIEDSQKEADEEKRWTIDDLRDIGFSERVLKGVDGVTLRPGEKYFDFIERCSLAGDDAITVKISDLKHNSDPTRYRHITDTPHQVLKAKAYNVAYHYLVDIKKTWADPNADYNQPGRSIVEYMGYRDGFWQEPEMANRLLDEFSSRPERLTGQQLAPGFNNALRRN